MKKILLIISSFVALATVGQAQQATGTLTGTITVPHSTAVSSTASTVTITKEGAYTVIADITYNTPGTVNSLYFSLIVNNVEFPGSINSAASLSAGTGTWSVPVPIVIASTGNNSIYFRISNNGGTSTYGPVGLKFYADASAAAIQALVTQQSADIASLTTAVNNLTTANSTQAADIAELKTSLSSLSSQLSGINTNASAQQLTAIQSSIQDLKKSMAKYASPLSNPWLAGQWGMQGLNLFGTAGNAYGVNKVLQNMPTKTTPGIKYSPRAGYNE